MKVLRAGHRYKVSNLDNPNNSQQIQFVEKAAKSGDPDSGELELVQDGTTNEELVKVLIDRTTYLNGKLPCPENERAIEHLENALAEFGARKNRRDNAGLTGTPKEEDGTTLKPYGETYDEYLEVLKKKYGADNYEKLSNEAEKDKLLNLSLAKEYPSTETGDEDKFDESTKELSDGNEEDEPNERER